MQIQRAPNFTPKFEYMLSTFCSNKHCANYIVGDDDIYISKLGEISQLYHGKIFNGGFLAKKTVGKVLHLSFCENIVRCVNVVNVCFISMKYLLY